MKKPRFNEQLLGFVAVNVPMLDAHLREKYGEEFEVYEENAKTDPLPLLGLQLGFKDHLIEVVLKSLRGRLGLLARQ